MTITIEELKDKLDYDPNTGVFVYKNIKGKTPGDVAGTITSDGYRRIKLNGHIYSAHQLAWFWMKHEWAVGVIDHIDGNRQNNSISNLRKVPHRVNSRNQKARVNSTGEQGIYWHRKLKRYRSRIVMDKKTIFEKYYREDQLELAITERQAKLLELGFHPNHGKKR